MQRAANRRGIWNGCAGWNRKSSQIPPAKQSLMPPRSFANPDQGLVNPQSFAAAGVPIAADGTYPFVRYVIRKKGELELGGNSCAWCHTRVMPDGSIVKGAQGNFPLDRVKAESLRAIARKGASAATIEQIVTPMITRFYRLLYAAPWIKPDPYERVARLSVEELLDAPTPFVVRFTDEALYALANYIYALTAARESEPRGRAVPRR